MREGAGSVAVPINALPLPMSADDSSAPVRHFATGMQAGFLGTPFRWSDVLVVAAWGVGGLLLAVRFFSWEPRRG